MKALLAALAAACFGFCSFFPAIAGQSETEFSPTAIAFHPTNPQLTCHANCHSASVASAYAYSLICSGDLAGAEIHLNEALAIEPDLFPARCNLGYVLNKTGRAKEALPHLLYAFYSFPNEPAVVQLLAGCYQLMGNLPAAIHLCNVYLSRFPYAQDRPYMESVTHHLINASATNQIQDYNWTKKTVRVFVKDGSGVRGFKPEFNQILKDSFKSWSDAGVLSFQYVSRWQDADIECVWTDDARQLGSLAEGGEALLKHQADKVSHARIVLLTYRSNLIGTLTQNEVRALCLHEIGHSLGLMRHSRNPSDVMYFTVASNANPSTRDIQQLKQLYSQ